MKKYVFRAGKSRLLRFLPVLAAALASLILVNDAQLYSETIVRITDERTVSVGTVLGDNGIREEAFRQTLTGTIQNGGDRGAVLTLQNDYTRSEVKTTRYRAGDQVFVRLQSGLGQKTAVILSAKRDVWLVGAAAVFACTLCLLYQGSGVWLAASLAFNVATIFLMLRFCNVNRFFDRGWPLLVVAFCAATLLAVNGFHRQTLGAMVSTLVTTGLVFLLYQLTIDRSGAVPYDLMSDTLGSLPIESVFRFSVIAGSLGAIMDVSVAIHISAEELAERRGVLDIRALWQSMRTIGADLMGTMMSILLFTYLGQNLPIVILKINSGYAVSAIFQYDLIFDVVRFLLGAVGIVLAIPVSEGVALLMYRGRRTC